MMNDRQFPPHNILAASFRDPVGRLFTLDGRIIRIIYKSGVPDLHALLSSTVAQNFVDAGRLVRTDVLDVTEAESLFKDAKVGSLINRTDVGMIVEHKRVPFLSFPYEWPPEMLYDAGCLTLDLAEGLLNEGIGLKDATPYNVLFCGPRAIFIDILSFERRSRDDPIWLAYGQFVRTFLLPLLVNKQFGISLNEVFTVRSDGIEVEEVYRLCGPLRKVMSPFLTLATIPTWLAARHSQDDTTIYKKKYLANPEKARFTLGSLFRHLSRMLDNLAPKGGRKSVWSNYVAFQNDYNQDHFAAKCAFVEGLMAEFGPKNVLDVGCNTGVFSSIAAKRGAHVVSVDYDPVVVGEVWRNACARKFDILPLVVNFTRPSPAIGWRNEEHPSFLARARGAFDAVLMLAVIHHMLVSERIPLIEIIDLAAELTTDFLVIEFIAPDDPMFRRLTRGRDHLFAPLNRELFEGMCGKHFRIVRSHHLDLSSRWLYLFRKKKLKEITVGHQAT